MSFTQNFDGKIYQTLFKWSLDRHYFDRKMDFVNKKKTISRARFTGTICSNLTWYTLKKSNETIFQKSNET